MKSWLEQNKLGVIFVMMLLIMGAAAGSSFDFIRLRPVVLPSTGANGEIRVDSSDGNLNKYSTSIAAWAAIAGTGVSSSGINMLTNYNYNAESALSTTWTETGGGTLAIISTAAGTRPRAMIADKWDCFNSQAVSTDTKENIVNGHQRLMACVQAGVPFRTLLITGVPPETFANEATGRAEVHDRSSRGVLVIHRDEPAPRFVLVRAVHLHVSATGWHRCSGRLSR